MRVAALLLLAAAVPWLQGRIDARVGPFGRTHEVLYLWSGRDVARLVPGFKGLAADIYWMRTVQYFGGQRRFARDKNFDLLYPLVDIATTLDPRLEIAYRYGAVFLSEPKPIGAGRPRDGVALLEKGSKALPDNWRLKQDLGFFHYLFLKDPEAASRVLMEASEIPGAALWLPALAADILLKSGERDGARRMWREILATSSAPVLRANAEERLQRLDALDMADGVGRLVEEFARRHGHFPARLEDLVAEGLLRQPPLDATGTPFAYDPSSGKVTLSRDSPLYRPD